MDVLALLFEPAQVWLRGGSWDAITSTEGFRSLAGLMAFLVPSSIIMLGVGLDHWRETPLAGWLGVSKDDPEADWAERARDLDKDGNPDF